MELKYRIEENVVTFNYEKGRKTPHQSHICEASLGRPPMEEKGGKQSSPFSPWSLWMPIAEAPLHIGRWLPKQCSELPSVPCNDSVTGRFITQKSYPNFISAVIPPTPLSASSISLPPFNHPETFRQALGSSFLDPRPPPTIVPHSCSTSQQSSAETLTIFCYHFPLSSQHFYTFLIK